MSHQLAIECVGLGKIYPGGNRALHDISLKLAFGEVYALVGPNGAGKSTLIHLLGGILGPSAGTVHRHIDSTADLAWVSQRTAVDWYLNVEENVLLGARLGGAYGKDARSRVREALEVVGLSSKSGARLDMLSGGEQQRTQIARALAQGARVLLLDEPTTGLDPGAARVLMEYLAQLAKGGRCILVSSHDLGLVDQYATDILVLQRGELGECPSRKQNVRIYYTGEIPNDVHTDLCSAGIRCGIGNPLEIEVESDTSLSMAMGILLDVVNITHIESSHALNGIFQHAIVPSSPRV